LPPPPGRVLEIGCGDEGGVVPALLEAGYDALGVDPRAPAGAHYRQGDFREVDGAFDAIVVARAGKPIGVLTRTDLLEYLAHRRDST